MTTLVINDLAASKELDSKELAGVSGGSWMDDMWRGFGFNLDFLSPDNQILTDNDVVGQAVEQGIFAPITLGPGAVAAPTYYQIGFNVADTGATQS